jgi:hypothetical protein
MVIARWMEWIPTLASTVGGKKENSMKAQYKPESGPAASRLTVEFTGESVQRINSEARAKHIGRPSRKYLFRGMKRTSGTGALSSGRGRRQKSCSASLMIWTLGLNRLILTLCRF